MITVRRADIHVEEQSEQVNYVQKTHWWEASFNGYLSTGEHAYVTGRYGKTAAEAVTVLEAALVDQGWDIEDSVSA